MAYSNVANVSAFLQITIDGTTTPSDTTVTSWIAEVDDEINRVTKSVFETTTVTDKIISTNSDTGFISATSFDGTGAYNQPGTRDQIQLPNNKILTLDAVAYNESADGETESWVDLTIGHGKQCVLVDNYIKILESGLPIPSQFTGMKVTYTHGNATVPGFVQKLATRMTVLAYNESGLANEITSGGGSIRVGDIEIDEPGSFTQTYIDTLNEWVDIKLRQLGTNNVYVI